ncbi:MAG TPA: DUF2066 domain-containing protein [Stellaceae bacterium]|nr:DUF2066 domain-containing protein [Stellaceae bacterium]
MALPLESTLAGARILRRCAGVALLLLAMAMQSGGSLAEDQSTSFSATVKVDAAADSAAAARELARLDGQRRALGLVVDRLSGSSDNIKLTKLDDKTITDMVESFEVANERMSAVRYLADYTFHFRPSKLRRLVRVADTPPAEGGGKPAVPESSGKPPVVLPVYKDSTRTALWDDPNPWREAWVQRSGDAGAVRVTVPLGDASDLAAIDADRAESGKSDALAAIAQRNGGDETIVALASAKRQGDRLVGLDMSIKWYRSGRLADAQANFVDALPGESEGDLLRRAADAVAAGVAGGARKNPGQQAILAASVPISSLSDWVMVRDRLASAAAVRRVDLLSLSRQEAKIQIRYVGSAEQLKSSLAEVDLGLGGADPVWQLQISSATGSR